MKALSSFPPFMYRTTNVCNCDSRLPDGKDFGELNFMESLPVTALRYGGALSPTSKMHVQLGSLKCTGKVGIYPSEKIFNWDEKQAFKKRLDTVNERMDTLNERINAVSAKFVPSTLGYSVVKSDFGIVVYKLYRSPKTRLEALNTCTGDGSFLHFPQPRNEQENLFYYNLIYPSIKHEESYTYGRGAIWLDISKSNSWSNYREGAPDSSDNPYTTMMFKTGEKDKNWNRVATHHKYYFVCTAVFK